jgi:hypothetical protein
MGVGVKMKSSSWLENVGGARKDRFGLKYVDQQICKGPRESEAMRAAITGRRKADRKTIGMKHSLDGSTSPYYVPARSV